MLCSSGSGCLATDSSRGYVRAAYPYAATTCTGTESVYTSVFEKQQAQGDTSSGAS